MRSRGFVSGLSGLLGTAPVAEGKYDGRALPSLIEEQPLSEMSLGKLPKIPLLTGITRDETKKACQGNILTIIMMNFNILDTRHYFSLDLGYSSSSYNITSTLST